MRDVTSSPRSAIANVTVRVGDVNDNSPIFFNVPYVIIVLVFIRDPTSISLVCIYN